MSDLQMYKGASMFTHDFGGIRVAQFWWDPCSSVLVGSV
jgi:hypothetical protein